MQADQCLYNANCCLNTTTTKKSIFTHTVHVTESDHCMYCSIQYMVQKNAYHILSWHKLIMYLQELTWEKYPTKLTGRLFGIHELVFCKIFSGYGVSNVILDLRHVNEIKMHQISFSCGRGKEDDFKHLL